MFFKIGILRRFANFTGKRLCWSLFLKDLRAGGLQLDKKRLQHSCFPVKFATFLRTPFLTEHIRWLFLHLRAASVFFLKKVLLNSYFATLLWRTNIFFFSTHRWIQSRSGMYTKSKSFVYKFVVNCQFFQIIPSGCTL